MKVLSARYLQGAVRKDQYPGLERPEVAFVGRSNVGKSSLINRLLNRKQLVQVSSTPGKTRLINFFDINETFYLVDLPGYGYARVPDSLREQWRRMVEEYLTGRLPLRGVVMLVDLRHKPTPADGTMLAWLRFHGYPAVLAATKADKVPRGRRRAALEVITGELGLTEDEPLVPCSAVTGEGKEALWRHIQGFLDR
jgi:GTP-binding protein